jgi:hypothetical protein
MSDIIVAESLGVAHEVFDSPALRRYQGSPTGACTEALPIFTASSVMSDCLLETSCHRTETGLNSFIFI